MKWYSIQEFADLIRISYGSVRRALISGAIPGAIKLNSTWRIPETAIAALQEDVK